MRYDELGEGEPGPLGGDRVEQTGGGRAGASPFGLIHEPGRNGTRPGIAAVPVVGHARRAHPGPAGRL